jgi:hypothetical protein
LSSSSKKNSGSEIPDIGKKEWLRKRNLYNKFDAVYIVDSAAHKKHYAFKTGILIDDYEKNINGWKDNGGIGILHKDIPSTIEQLKKYV